MTEQQASGADVTAQPEVSDAEFEKYFESGGDESVEPSEENQEPVKTPDAKEEKQQTAETEKEEQHDRNYKAAMHEERERRKELQRQVEEVRQKNARMEEAFQRVMYAREQQQIQQQQPSYEDDPVGTIKNRQENLERFLSQQAQAYQQQQQQIAAQQQFINRYQESAKAFLQDKPDFLDAYKYIAEERTKELRAAGYNDQHIAALLHEDEAAIVANAYNDGVNPAERIYNFARARGYQGSAKQFNNTQKLSTLEKGIAASKSLSGASGKTASGKMSLEDIAGLSDKEFSKIDWDEMVLSHG